MFVTTKQMLLDAQAGHYAVGAFNAENLGVCNGCCYRSRRAQLFFRPPGTIKYASSDYFAARFVVLLEVHEKRTKTAVPSRR